MFVRSLTDVECTNKFVEWGNGTSHRLITREDNMGFSICYTVVHAGTESKLQYHRHLEACYCIDGAGEIENIEGQIFSIKKGNLYALDMHDSHLLRADKEENLILISVFNPPLNGDEKHDLKKSLGSGY